MSERQVRITFAATPELKRRLRIKAIERDTTVTAVLTALVKRWLEEEEEEDEG